MNYYSLLKFEIWGKQNGDELDELCHEPRESSSGENVCSCGSKSSQSRQHNGIGTSTYNGQVLYILKILLKCFKFYCFHSRFYTHDMLSLYLNIFREGCLLLYGPKPPTNQGGARSLKGDGKALPTFEIAVHSSKYSTQSLSIFRTSDKGINYNQSLHW